MLGLDMAASTPLLPKLLRSEDIYCRQAGQHRTVLPRHVHVSTRAAGPPGCEGCQVGSPHNAPLALDVSIFKQRASTHAQPAPTHPLGETGHVLQELWHSRATGGAPS